MGWSHADRSYTWRPPSPVRQFGPTNGRLSWKPNTVASERGPPA